MIKTRASAESSPWAAAVRDLVSSSDRLTNQLRGRDCGQFHFTDDAQGEGVTCPRSWAGKEHRGCWTLGAWL